MIQCTVGGDRDLLGLSVEELRQLKQTYIEYFHSTGTPHLSLSSAKFESISQACKT